MRPTLCTDPEGAIATSTEAVVQNVALKIVGAGVRVKLSGKLRVKLRGKVRNSHFRTHPPADLFLTLTNLTNLTNLT